MAHRRDATRVAAATTSAESAGALERPGTHGYRVILPSASDPRLHVAAVVLSIHALGQITLGFAVSIPQIGAAILSCGLLELVIRFRREQVIAWPASAMLTGSGVALILRDAGTEAGDHWTFTKWWLFALVAVGSLATKYVVRWGGAQVFNPSNVGLVATFVLLGSERVEPLDFWWKPLGLDMLVAYWVILFGGLLITERLQLLEMAAAFWGTFVACMGVLALTGHCFTAPWSLTPVCDWRFFWTVILSPETLIFLFFMITDPQTVPDGRAARIVFGASVAMTSALLLAPQRTEFGAKVALLSGLVIVCVVRAGFRNLPAPTRRALPALPRRSWLVLPLAGFFLCAVVVAGARAREAHTAVAIDAGIPHPREIVPEVDDLRVPAATVDPAVHEVFGADLDTAAVAAELVRLLDIEARAIASADPDLLPIADHGVRLSTMRGRVASGQWQTYDFDGMHLVVTRASGQGGVRIGVDGQGVVTENNASGPGVSREFALRFVLRPGSDARWFLVDVVDLP